MSPKKRTCSHVGCKRWVQNRLHCSHHGAIIYRCRHVGCPRKQYSSGFCRQHGAKVLMCSVKGCMSQARKGGICRKHGATVKLCSTKGCSSQARKGGMCQRHGSKALLRNKTCEAEREEAQDGGLNEETTHYKLCPEITTKQEIYHEFQRKSLCAIHVLNAILQRPQVTEEFMNDIGKKLFLAAKKQYRKTRQSEFYNKRNGSYGIDVVKKAAEELGINLNHMTSDDIHKVLQDKELSPAYVIHTNGSEPHYYTILLIDGSYWNLDSLERWPSKIDREELKNIIGDCGETFTCFKVGFKSSHSLDESNHQRPPPVSESKPCTIDESNMGYWWSIAFLQKLAEERVALNVSMSGYICSHKLSMNATETVGQCFESFFQVDCDCIRDNNERKVNEVNIELGGGEVATYNKSQWDRLPVKLISEHNVLFCAERGRSSRSPLL